MSIVRENSFVLARFEFSSDHRIARCLFSIIKRVKRAAYKKANSQAKWTIPIYKLEDARQSIERTLNQYLGSVQHHEVQKLNDKIVKILWLTINKFECKKSKENIDDKLTLETKQLIEKRERLRGKVNLTPLQRKELAKLKKLVRKEIRKDCKEFDAQKTTEIIE